MPAGSVWNIQRLALYHSGRAEAVYSDGSAAILHPSAKGAKGPMTVTFFACNGVRQRLLSSCLPREFCGKILAAATIRDRFHPMPSVLSSPAKKRLRRLQLLTHVVWPSCDMGTQRHEDGSISIESLDRNSKLLLAPHGRSYVVEWWQPVPSTDRESHMENAPGCQMATESFGTGVGYEHIYQVQCFYVEHVEIPWLYPLFLALMQHVAPSADAAYAHSSTTRRLVGLKARLEDCLATGQLVDSGKGVTAPLPSNGPNGLDTVGNACDHVSPAVCMGEVSEGPVRVLWTPTATLWLHPDRGEATIDVSCGTPTQPAQCLLMESSLKGRFWKRLGPGGPGGPGGEVILSEMKSVSTGPESQRVLELIDEAAQWLRHNALAATRSTGCSDTGSTGSTGFPSAGPSWVPELEISEGKVHLTIFTSGTGDRHRSASYVGPRLLRLLFADGARLSFTIPSCLPSLPSSLPLVGHFRLILASGEVLHRSFAEPWGAEFHVATLRALLRSRQEATDAMEPMEAVAQSALRRSHLAYKSIGRLVATSG